MEMENEESFLFTGGSGTAVTDIEKLFHSNEETDAVPAYALLSNSGSPGRVVVAISDDQLGTGDRMHGEELMHDLLEALCDRVTLPDEVVFYHKGVLLLVKDHPAAQIIHELCSLDVEIKVCKESLEFYKKEPAAHNMQPVPMAEIISDLLKAGKVVKL